MHHRYVWSSPSSTMHRRGASVTGLAHLNELINDGRVERREVKHFALASL